jgi:hypothetical protein
MRAPVADLRKNDMDFKVFWESEARTRETQCIAKDGCWCTHVCFIHDSLRYSPRALLWDIPKNYLLRKVW